MIICEILRTNRTVKRKRVRNKADSFNFEEGKYFIDKKHVLLYKVLFGYRPKLFYIENVAEPISFENITWKENPSKEHQILIDAKSIHNLTSRELLRVLTSKRLTKMELFLLLISFFTFLLVVGLYAIQYT